MTREREVLSPESWAKIDTNLKRVSEILPFDSEPLEIGNTSLLLAISRLVDQPSGVFKEHIFDIIKLEIVPATDITWARASSKLKPPKTYAIERDPLRAAVVINEVPRVQPTYLGLRRVYQWEKIVEVARNNLVGTYPDLAAVIRQIGGDQKDIPLPTEAVQIMGWFESQHTLALDTNPMKQPLKELSSDLRNDPKKLVPEKGRVTADPNLVSKIDLERIVRSPIEGSGEIDFQRLVAEHNAQLITLVTAVVSGKLVQYRGARGPLTSWQLAQDIGIVLRVMNAKPQCQSLADVVQFTVKTMNRR